MCLQLNMFTVVDVMAYDRPFETPWFSNGTYGRSGQSKYFLAVSSTWELLQL